MRLNRRVFTIEDEGLRVVSKSVAHRSEDFFPYENIGRVITHEKRRLLIPLLISALFLAFSLAMFVGTLKGNVYEEYAVRTYLIIGILFYLIHYIFGKNYVVLSDDEKVSNIEFLGNQPSKSKLNNFIELLQNKKKEYLINRYGEFDVDRTYDEHRDALRWLKHNKVIDQTEFRERLAKIEGHFQEESDQQPTNRIGFKKND